MKYKAFWTAIIACFAAYLANAKTLQPGFDASEYINTLHRCAGQSGHKIYPKTATLPPFVKIYSSPEMGLHNKWELWKSFDSSTIAINLRGTVRNTDNGLENIYAAMIPASGHIQLTDTGLYAYKFAADTRALVHTGWAIGICSMTPDIVNHIKEQYLKGVRNIIIEGHSQGGALAFLLTSQLHYLVAEGKIPADITIKTYCSAAPKPGNLYYAYDYSSAIGSEWSFTVVSSIDWVAEMPFTVQRYTDVSEVNPFTGDKSILKKQKLFARLYLKHVYNKTNRATRRAQRRFEHYLGKTTYKFLRKYMPGVKKPVFANSANYAHAGTLVVMTPDEAYYKKFEGGKEHIFMHHFYEQYYFLAKRIFMHEDI